MIPTTEQIETILFDWAPLDLAEEWDNCGLQVGDPDQKIQKIIICLDATEDTLIKALAEKADLIICHHPLIFKPLRSLNLKDRTTRLLAGFLRHNISVISMHTNLDSVKGGVNDRLCELIGIREAKPLIPNANRPNEGLGRIGYLKEPMEPNAFIEHLAKVLSKKVIYHSNINKGKIHKVAVCSGSGSSLFDAALASSADAYVTGEVKHSTALEANASGLLLIDAGHFHTEWPVVRDLFSFLQRQREEKDWELEIIIFDNESSPLIPWLKK